MTSARGGSHRPGSGPGAGSPRARIRRPYEVRASAPGTFCSMIEPVSASITAQLRVSRRPGRRRVSSASSWCRGTKSEASSSSPRSAGALSDSQPAPRPQASTSASRPRSRMRWVAGPAGVRVARQASRSPIRTQGSLAVRRSGPRVAPRSSGRLRVTTRTESGTASPYSAVAHGLRPLLMAGVALLAVGAAAVPSTALAEDWAISSFDARISVQADGSLAVTEDIEVNFVTPHHGIFRDIPVVYDYDQKYNRVLQLDMRSVTDASDRPWQYTTSRNGANEEIKIGDPNQTLTGRQSYRLTYTVSGAFNGFPDHDELYWNVTGNQWAAPIAAASATVSTPLGSLQRQ